MKDTGLIGGLYALCEWIMRFSIVNLLWVLFNLPIVFLVLNMLYVDNNRGILLLLVPITILAPFLLFPATAAMFALVRDWIQKEDRPIIKSFLIYYKDNYKKSFFAGLFLTFVWVVWAADYYYLSQHSLFVTTVFLILGVILYVFTINFFSVNAHYDMNVRNLLKRTFYLTFGSPVLFLTVIISGAIIIYITVYNAPFLFPFFSVSISAFLAFSAFYRLYLKLTKTETN